MIQPIIGKAPRVERDWESYSYRRSSRGGRKRNAGEKKKRKERKKTRNCARRKRERGISWVSIVNGCVYGEYDRALKTWIDKSLYL